jgi:phosphoribosylaminoimidazole-succinocarboxamide synthase
MSDEYCNEVSERYIELFELITGDKFVKEDVSDVINRVENNIMDYLK